MKAKRFFAAVLCAMLLMTLFPAVAFAEMGIQADTPTLTINSSTVAFGGREWYVIGDGSTGVNPVPGNITLLAKETPEVDATAFRSSASSGQAGYTQYPEYPERPYGYYADNPSGLSAWSIPVEYAGSTLQQKMEALANELGSDEQALITARDLTASDWATGDDIATQDISGQKYWALSKVECETIDADATNGKTVLIDSAGNWWWLRSPYFDIAAYCVYTEGNPDPELVNIDVRPVSYGDSDPDIVLYILARPAFNLNLESVLFTSSASAGGKSSVTAGSGFVSTAAPTGTVKFTMQVAVDDARDAFTAFTKTLGDTLTIEYENATVGANEYVSAVIKDGDGTVTHYAKLAQPTATAGVTTLTLPTGFDSATDAVYVFSEQCNGDYNTDYSSNMVRITAFDIGKLELRSDTTSGYIQWRYDNETTWHDLVALSDLTGSAGAAGREIELRTDTASGYIQWRYKGDTSWTNLTALSVLTGADGLTPFIGPNGNWWIGTSDTGVPASGAYGTNGRNGRNGTDGADGLTPFIGLNGNWWIGTTDTGVAASGAAGADGADGKDGKDGVGISSIEKTGSNGNADAYTITLTDGTTSSFTVTNGKDGAGISAVKIDDAGELIVTLTDGTELNAGSVREAVQVLSSPQAVGSSTDRFARGAALLALLGNAGWIIPLLNKRRRI